MSFFDVLSDMLMPSSLDALGKINKLVQVSKKMGKQPAEKDIEALSSVLKKGWIEVAEKQVRNEAKRFDAALRVKSSLPDNKIDKLERKVIASYKKERKNGLDPSDCKVTLRAIRDLEREVARHEKELIEYAKSELLARKIALKVVQKYKPRQKAATVLRDTLGKALQNPAYGILSSEIVVYFLQCKGLAKYLNQAMSSAKKLGDRAMKDGRLGQKSAKYTSNQLFYIRSSDYLEDLEGRIR